MSVKIDTAAKTEREQVTGLIALLGSLGVTMRIKPDKRINIHGLKKGDARTRDLLLKARPLILAHADLLKSEQPEPEPAPEQPVIKYDAPPEPPALPPPPPPVVVTRLSPHAMKVLKDARREKYRAVVRAFEAGPTVDNPEIINYDKHYNRK